MGGRRSKKFSGFFFFFFVSHTHSNSETSSGPIFKISFVSHPHGSWAEQVYHFIRKHIFVTPRGHENGAKPGGKSLFRAFFNEEAC